MKQSTPITQGFSSSGICRERGPDLDLAIRASIGTQLFQYENCCMEARFDDFDILSYNIFKQICE
jgi:hypothetical protein